MTCGDLDSSLTLHLHYVKAILTFRRLNGFDSDQPKFSDAVFPWIGEARSDRGSSGPARSRTARHPESGLHGSLALLGDRARLARSAPLQVGLAIVKLWQGRDPVELRPLLSVRRVLRSALPNASVHRTRRMIKGPSADATVTRPTKAGRVRTDSPDEPRQSDDASTSCRVSRQLDPPGASSTCKVRLTTLQLSTPPHLPIHPTDLPSRSD